MAMGAYAKYLFVVPSLNVTVVSMGLTFGKSSGCPGGYDDSYTLSLIWRALAPALISRGQDAPAAASVGPSAESKAPNRESAAPPEAARIGVKSPGDGAEVAGSCKCYCECAALSSAYM